MLYRIILHFFIIIALGIAQSAFVTALPGWAGLAQIVLMVLIFLLGLNKAPLSFAYAFFIGLFMDIASLAPFGLYTAALTAADLAAWLALKRFVTNRSLYAYLLLGLLANLSFKAVFFGLWFLLSWLVSSQPGFWPDQAFFLLELRSLIFNLGAVYVIFYLVSFISRKYQPVFLSAGSSYGKT